MMSHYKIMTVGVGMKDESEIQEMRERGGGGGRENFKLFIGEQLRSLFISLPTGRRETMNNEFFYFFRTRLGLKSSLKTT